MLMIPRIKCLLLSLFTFFQALVLAQTIEFKVGFDKDLGPMRMEQMALGQGGLSPEPMLDGRINEIRALKPAVIRLFVSEYYEVISETGVYHFETLDAMIQDILATGAKPFMAFAANTSSPEVHGFAAHDSELEMYNLMLWNFSDQPKVVNLNLENIPRDVRVRHMVLDATVGSTLENQRLRPDPFVNIHKGTKALKLTLEPGRFITGRWSSRAEWNFEMISP